MSHNHDVSLHDVSTSADSGLASPNIGEEETNTGETTARQKETKKTRTYVLLGNSILQLPIWGFAMSYGVFQEYYNDKWTFKGSRDITGIIGTTSNGVMYLSMPFLFGLFTKRWARRRHTAAFAGVALAGLSFILSSFSTEVWHLVATQGVLAALGCALIFSPMTLSLGEWFSTSGRAVAYGVTLSSKNVVGATCTFMFRGLLDRYGFSLTLRIWMAILVSTSILGILLIPTHPSSLSEGPYRRRKVPWHFLKHQTIYIYCIAIIMQSAGYGIPQTYLSTYAREVAMLSQTTATLLLTLFNLPGILASSFFGYLSDNKYLPLTATTVTSISAIATALSTFLLWGLTSKGSMALLIMFSIVFGFFAGGYSGTWGGVINELESEAARWNEAVDTGLLYGLLNGARGIGYVSGGLASVPLLNAGAGSPIGKFAYSTNYGPLIIFTGLTTAFGGCGLLMKWKKLWHWV